MHSSELSELEAFITRRFFVFASRHNNTFLQKQTFRFFIDLLFLPPSSHLHDCLGDVYIVISLT